jgi:hypothetical protein
MAELAAREFVVVTSFPTVLARELTPVLGDRVYVCEEGEDAIAAVGARTTDLFADFQSLPDRWTGLRLARWAAGQPHKSLRCWLMVDVVRDFHVACAKQAGAAGAVARSASALLGLIGKPVETDEPEVLPLVKGFPDSKQGYMGPTWRAAVNNVFKAYTDPTGALQVIESACTEGMFGDFVDAHLYIERLAMGLPNVAQRAAFCSELRSRQLIAHSAARG